MNTMTRREFAKTAAWVGVAAATGARAQTPPSDRIRLGFIGLGNRGDQVLTAFLEHADAQVVAICDLYQPHLDLAAKKIGGEPSQYKDYRRVLDRKDINAVVIATPDHWHALQMIHACEAGKDVYVEKPLSLCVSEGRAMVNAARHYQRVTQVGLQRRSSKLCAEAMELIRAGAIGKVTVVRAFHIQNEWPHGIGRPDDSQPPADFDWDAWLGPAPQRAYNKNRTLYRFRWFYDYSGGQLTNMGTHYLDMVHRALGEEAPKSVAALGGKFADFDNREIPDTMEAMWTYPSGTLVTFSQFNASSAEATARPCQVEFRGTKGTLYFSNEAYEIVPETIPAREFPVLSPLDRAAAKGWRSGSPMIEPRQAKGPSDTTAAHALNFLDCIKSRKPCNCDIETGHRSTTATLIANIAHKTGAVLQWDAQAERFTNHDEANRLLRYEYRKPYEFPPMA
jgi:predicted dehydrogenase